MGDSVPLRNDHDYQLHKQWNLQEEMQGESNFLVVRYAEERILLRV